MDQTNCVAYCRICGSNRLNKFHYASDKMKFHQILRRDGSLDQLIRPCECRGEFAFAHKACLSEWIETTRHVYCDICRFKYNLIHIERSWLDWLFETDQLKDLLRVSSVALLVYYVGAIGILACTGRPFWGVLDIMVISSAYIWIVGCSLAITLYTLGRYNDFSCWRAISGKVIVEENKNPQLDIEIKPKDVLKSSGFKPK